MPGQLCRPWVKGAGLYLDRGCVVPLGELAWGRTCTVVALFRDPEQDQQERPHTCLVLSAEGTLGWALVTYLVPVSDAGPVERPAPWVA